MRSASLSLLHRRRRSASKRRFQAPVFRSRRHKGTRERKKRVLREGRHSPRARRVLHFSVWRKAAFARRALWCAFGRFGRFRTLPGALGRPGRAESAGALHSSHGHQLADGPRQHQRGAAVGRGGRFVDDDQLVAQKAAQQPRRGVDVQAGAAPRSACRPRRWAPRRARIHPHVQRLLVQHHVRLDDAAAGAPGHASRFAGWPRAARICRTACSGCGARCPCSSNTVLLPAA